jgi:thiol-disulfide isomerase/thioredoxin
MTEIVVEEWINDFGNVITSYTADWCNPCQRIKPFFENYLDLGEYRTCGKFAIEKHDKPDYVVAIPFFILESPDPRQPIKKIQTSDYKTLRKFMGLE